MTYKRLLMLALGLCPIAAIWLLGFGALDDIREAYTLACGNNIGLSQRCGGIDEALDTLGGGIFLMTLLYIVAAEGVRRMLWDRL